MVLFLERVAARVALSVSGSRGGPKLSVVALAACLGCRAASVSTDPPGAATSPQAKAEPAPLVSPPSLASSTSVASPGSDARPEPAPLRIDEPIAPDVLREVVREPGGKESTREARELAGYMLQAVMRSGEGPAAPRAPEVNAAAIDSAKRKTEARLTIEISASRARFVIASGFVLPQGTELRARVDRYGHLLFWPGEPTYRVVQPGALRALVGERRLDIAPLAAAEVRSGGEGRRLNLRTRHIEIWTRAGRASLELALLREAGDGGSLVCRFLLDLMSASPSASPCATDEVPLHAELRWATRGALTFDVSSIARQIDIPPQDLAVPPAGLGFVEGPPAAQPYEVLLQKAELAAFRTAPIDAPPAAVRDARQPEAGLVLANSTDELRLAWIDGVPVAWLGPGERIALPSLLRGRYAVQWRTFLGDSWEPADALTVPGTSEVGALR